MRTLALAVSLSLVPAAVVAQEKDPDEQRSIDAYKKGVTAYDLGKFDDAIEAFQKAYELKPTPAYLYNIAQAYRQKGDPGKAVFFYKRYLQKSPDAPNRATVEKRIGELEELARKQEEQKAKPPAGLDGEKGERVEPTTYDKTPEKAKPAPVKPPPPKTEKADKADKPPKTVAAAPRPPRAPPPTEPVAGTVTAAAPARPSRVRLALEAGPAFTSLGGGPDVPTQISARLGVAYVVHLGRAALDLGVAETFTPLPFETLDRQDSGTAMMLGALANVTARFPVAGKLGLRLELGGGVIFMNGLADGNPFTDAGAESGSITMPHLRAAAGADLAVGGGLLVTLTPAFSVSKAGDGLDPRIDQITRFDVLLGLAYGL